MSRLREGDSVGLERGQMTEKGRMRDRERERERTG